MNFIQPIAQEFGALAPIISGGWFGQIHLHWKDFPNLNPFLIVAEVVHTDHMCRISCRLSRVITKVSKTCQREQVLYGNMVLNMW